MIRVFINNLGKYNEGHLVGEWLELPTTKNQIDDFLAKIQINKQYEEYFISDYECDVFGLREILGEYEHISVLNKLAERLLELDKYDLEKLESIIEYESCDLLEVINVTYTLDNFFLCSNVNNDEDLGRYFAEEENLYDVPDNLSYYIDYERLGYDLAINFGGSFTSNGFIYGELSSYLYSNEQEIIDEQYELYNVTGGSK